MKIYHTETQEDYDALMMELEERGAKWYSGAKTVDTDIWNICKECTCVRLKNNIITYGGIELYEKDYPDIPIQKYKAKKGYKAEEYVSMPRIKAIDEAKKRESVRILNQAIGKALSSSHDNVNSPKHYTQGELEVIDILQDKLTPQEFEGFLKGNILKYTFREGIKNGTEDMKKGAWYMSKLIDFRNEQEAEHAQKIS